MSRGTVPSGYEALLSLGYALIIAETGAEVNTQRRLDDSAGSRNLTTHHLRVILSGVGR